MKEGGILTDAEATFPKENITGFNLWKAKSFPVFKMENII